MERQIAIIAKAELIQSQEPDFPWSKGQGLDLSSFTFPCPKQRAGLEVEHLGHQTASI